MTDKELIQALRGTETRSKRALLDEAADRIERMQWIPVEEKLPESGVPVLINYIGNADGRNHPDGVAVWTGYGCLWWEGGLKDCYEDVAVPITHWMPLPEAPEVEKALEVKDG